jgi:hypothetical protein
MIRSAKGPYRSVPTKFLTWISPDQLDGLEARRSNQQFTRRLDIGLGEGAIFARLDVQDRDLGNHFFLFSGRRGSPARRSSGRQTIAAP